MTREEARKAAEVMLAYADGKEIEYCQAGIPVWIPATTPNFDWDATKYRIKKEPTYRPFKDKEECWAEMQKHQPFGWVIVIVNGMYGTYSSIIALFDRVKTYSSSTVLSYDEAFKEYTFADGTPFGIKEE